MRRDRRTFIGSSGEWYEYLLDRVVSKENLSAGRADFWLKIAFLSLRDIITGKLPIMGSVCTKNIEPTTESVR